MAFRVCHVPHAAGYCEVGDRAFLVLSGIPDGSVLSMGEDTFVCHPLPMGSAARVSDFAWDWFNTRSSPVGKSPPDSVTGWRVSTEADHPGVVLSVRSVWLGKVYR